MALPTATFKDATDFQLIAQAVDKAGNQDVVGATVTFHYDITAPTATITNITYGSNSNVSFSTWMFVNSTPVFSGVSADNYSGVNQIQISIRQNGSAEYLVGSIPFPVGNSAGEKFLNAAPTSIGVNPYSTWQYDSGAAAVLWYDATYYIRVQASDNANNFQTFLSTYNMIYDAHAPTAYIGAPTNGGLINFIPSISGTAADQSPIFSNKSVFVAILKNDGFSTWWNQNLSPPDFQTSGTPIWNLVTSTVGALSPNATFFESIRLTGLNSKMPTNTNFVILSSACDQAGNFQNTVVAQSSISIHIGKTAPTSSITFPLNDAIAGQGRYNPENVGWLNGTNNYRFTGVDAGYDGTSVLETSIRLHYALAGVSHYWTGSDFSQNFASSAWLTTSNNVWAYDTDVLDSNWNSIITSSATFSLGLPFILESRAQDNTTTWTGTGNGNYQTILSTNIFMVTNYAPTIHISAPSVPTLSNWSVISGTVNASIVDYKQININISTNGTGQPYYWTSSSWTTNLTWLQALRLNATSWTYSIPPGSLTALSYTVVASALDNAGHTQQLTRTVVVTPDIDAPTSAVTYPINGAVYSQAQTSTPWPGQSLDPGLFMTGVTSAAVSVMDLSASQYLFCRIKFYYPPSLLSGSNRRELCSNWIFANTHFTFIDDHLYNIVVIATDAVKNTALSSVVSFSYDVDIPTFQHQQSEHEICDQFFGRHRHGHGPAFWGSQLQRQIGHFHGWSCGLRCAKGGLVERQRLGRR